MSEARMMRNYRTSSTGEHLADHPETAWCREVGCIPAPMPNPEPAAKAAHERLTTEARAELELLARILGRNPVAAFDYRCSAHIEALLRERDAARAVLEKVRAWREDLRHYGCDHDRGACEAPSQFFWQGDRVHGMFDALDAALSAAPDEEGKEGA